MLDAYENYLTLRYGKAKAKIVLGLKVSAMLNTVLRRQGIRSYAPVGIVVQSEEQADWLEEDLRIFATTPCLSLMDKTETFVKGLQGSKDDICFVRYRSGGKAEYLLEILHAYTQTGYGDRGGCIGTPIVCFVGYVPTVAKRFFEVMISMAEQEGDTSFDVGKRCLTVDFQSLLVDFVLQKFSLVERELKRAVMNVQRADSNANELSCTFLRAAGIVYSLLLEAQGREGWQEWRSQYEAQVNVIQQQSSDFHADTDLSSVLRLLLNEAVEAGLRVVHRNELLGDDVKALEDIMLFDDAFYYISETEFSRVCYTLTSYMSKNQIKAELAEVGVIVGSGGRDGKRGYNTIKLPICGVYGNRMTPRMIRLCREKLDVAGEEELWQIAENLRGGARCGTLCGTCL